MLQVFHRTASKTALSLRWYSTKQLVFFLQGEKNYINLGKQEGVLLREKFHWLRLKIKRIIPHLQEEALQEVEPVISARIL